MFAKYLFHCGQSRRHYTHRFARYCTHDYTHKLSRTIVSISPRCLYFSACVVAALLINTPISAQTRFEWPDSHVDIRRYTYLETCMAMTNRVRDSVEARSAVLNDTLYRSLDVIKSLQPQDVISSARQCVARFTTDQIPLEDAFFAQQLYLIAGQDAKAEAIVQRRLDALPATDTVNRAIVLDTMILNYLAATPARLSKAKAIADQSSATLRRLHPYQYFILYRTLAEACEALEDSPALQRYGQAAIDFAAAVVAKNSEKSIVVPAQVLIWTMNRKLHRKELLDSLRISTQAKQSLEAVLYAKVLGDRAVKSSPRAVAPAPPITADFWFPQSARNVSYPRPGRVTVVTSVSVNEDIDGRSAGMRTVLNRLILRYPTVDFVAIANTQGYFGSAEPPSPEREAALIDTLFRGFRGLHLTLGVTNTKFWRLPPIYDRRRINESESVPYYTIIHGMTTVIDPDGVAAERGILLHPSTERHLEEVIAALLGRTKRTASSQP